MKRKSIDTRALELACDRLLKVRYRNTQTTMYDGKWEQLINLQANHFRKLAKEKKR